MTADVTALNAPPPSTEIRLGTPIRCADGDIDPLGGVVLNPSTNSFEYLIVGTGQNPHLVPRGRVNSFGETIELDLNRGDLQRQPQPDQQAPTDAGVVTSHLGDLCLATAQTQVTTAEGSVLGRFAGIVVVPQLDYVVREILLDGGGQHVSIGQIQNSTPEELRITPRTKDAAAEASAPGVRLIE